MAQTTIQGSFLGDATVTGAKIGADFISAQTELTTTLATADEIIVSDAGVIKRIDISVWSASTETFTNKSIDLGTNTLTGSVAEFNTALQSESFATLGGTEVLVAKTLTSPVFNTGVSGTAILDEDNLATDSATQLATQQSIKAYADTKAPIAGATLTGTTQFATLSDGTIAVTAWVDEDNMSSNSATLIPTQQSVKAYVDTTATIADDSIVEAKLDVSNGPTNGQFLQAQSGEGGGLTWAAATSDYTDVLIDGTVNSLLVLRNVHNEVSTLTSTTVVDGGPWEFFDGDQATLSKALVLLGGYKVTFPSSTNQRGHFRFPTGFGSYGSSYSVTSAQDWTISARIVLTGTASLDFFMGMCLHTDTADSTYNSASRNYKHRIGIGLDGISDNWHVFVDDDGTETQQDSSTSPSGGAVHRLTLKIRNNGALVQGFIDGVQMGSDITSNIPTLTDGMLLCGIQAKGSNPAAQTCEIQDLIAYREA